MIKSTFNWLDAALSWLSDIFQDVYACLYGFTAAAIGYFIPIKDMVHLVLIFFLIDVVIGYWAAKKLRKESFNPSIIWNKTIPRAAISVIMIMCTHAWDVTFSQDYISTSGFIGWFIAGIIVASIAKNGYEITNWKPFETISSSIKEQMNRKKRTLSEEEQ